MYHSCRIPQGVQLRKSKKRSCVGCNRRFKLRCFEEVEGKKQEEDAGIEEEILQKTVIGLFVFFFVPETSPLFFFSLVGHRLRLVRCFLLLGGGCCRGSRGKGGKHSQHTRPVLYIFERRICQPRATHPNSPTHFAVAPRTGGGLVFSVLLLFKNTDDKTHQYSTGGWEGWIRSFLQLTELALRGKR